jgi:hypothetical protein
MIHHVTMFTLETADRVREVPEVLQWFGRHDLLGPPPDQAAAPSPTRPVVRAASYARRFAWSSGVAEPSTRERAGARHYTPASPRESAAARDPRTCSYMGAMNRGLRIDPHRMLLVLVAVVRAVRRPTTKPGGGRLRRALRGGRVDPWPIGVLLLAQSSDDHSSVTRSLRCSDRTDTGSAQGRPEPDRGCWMADGAATPETSRWRDSRFGRSSDTAGRGPTPPPGRARFDRAGACDPRASPQARAAHLCRKRRRRADLYV